MNPKLICLTPVLNEAWILDRFIRCTSLWADYIIIGDQGSTDGSVEIAKKYDKVIFIDNKKMSDFNETQMRAPLFENARKIDGPKILFSLDADEILTPNLKSLEWDTIRNSKPGTVISIQRNDLLPNGKYHNSGDYWCGYVDDGTPFVSGTIHAPRSIMQSGPEHDVISCKEIQMLHYKNMDKNRMMDRQRWYQCFELVNNINKPIPIFRRYHYLDAIKKEDQFNIPDWWASEYAKHGIEITSIIHKSEQQWNRYIISYMITYEASFFRHLNIWDVNWDEKATSLGITHTKSFRDPRHAWEKAVNRWLINTQGKQEKIRVRIMEKILRKIYK